MIYKGLNLDKFQIDAIKAINENKSVIVSAPTGSGKTIIADYIIDKDLKKGIKVIYTAPIKALSNQKYKEFSEEFGEDKIGLLTGDIVKNPDAQVLIMTTEIYRNMAITNDEFLQDVTYVVFDEIHYINDIERGYVWEESIIFSNPRIRMLCLSATIPNADEFADWIKSIKNHEVAVIKHNIRSVPLETKIFDSELGLTTLEDIKEVINIPDYTYVMGKSRKRQKIKAPSHVELIKEIKDKVPCLFFNFSRDGCQKNAKELSKHNLFKKNPVISSFVREKLSEVTTEIGKLNSTRILRQILPQGIAFHHAGLLPIIKEIIEELFSKGLINVLYTTETFAVGINMPAKTVCFESLRKFDGIGFRFLNSKEFFQIAGRAGRRGIDKKGFVFPMIHRYDFEYQKIKAFTTKDIDPLKSQFRLSYNTILNLIKQYDNEKIIEILGKSFYSYQETENLKVDKVLKTFISRKKKLEKMGYINNNKLTSKGEFGSQIYSDVLILGEIFGTEMYKELDVIQIMLILACLSYEPREKTEFYKKYQIEGLKKLTQLIYKDEFLSKEKRFDSIIEISSIINPCYHGSDIFKILENTNLLEGDIIRFFRQILDKVGQIKGATQDIKLEKVLDTIKEVISHSLKDVDNF